MRSKWRPSATVFRVYGFPHLFPNLKGYDRAIAAGIRHLEFVIAASDTFNNRNFNLSTAESLHLLNQVSCAAERDAVTVGVGFSTSFHCPFEGEFPAAHSSILFGPSPRIPNIMTKCSCMRSDSHAPNGVGFSG